MMTQRVRLCFALFMLAQAAAVVAAPPPDEPVIRFLDKEASAKAIVAEKIEPYFSLLPALDMAAKTGSPLTGDTLAEQREACRRRCAALKLDFTKEDQTLLRACIERG